MAACRRQRQHCLMGHATTASAVTCQRRGSDYAVTGAGAEAPPVELVRLRERAIGRSRGSCARRTSVAAEAPAAVTNR